MRTAFVISATAILAAAGGWVAGRHTRPEVPEPMPAAHTTPAIPSPPRVAGDPIPDGRTIDMLDLSFPDGPGQVFAPTCRFTLKADGAATYWHSSEPYTGSGGTITKKQWNVGPDVAVAVLAGAVADGLLELPDDKSQRAGCRVAVGHGRWVMYFNRVERPEAVVQRLVPLLRQAHPEAWGKQP